jgi:hypothetical protein
MTSRNGRLSLALEVPSVARRGDDRTPTKSEAPAATLVAVPVCEARTRGLTTPHRSPANEGVDMTKSTRGPSPVDRWTRTSGVNITPPDRDAEPVPTTPAVA